MHQAFVDMFKGELQRHGYDKIVFSVICTVRNIKQKTNFDSIIKTINWCLIISTIFVYSRLFSAICSFLKQYLDG